MTAPARIVSALVCVATLTWGASAPLPKLDTAWKKYTNKNDGYCVEYPSHWARAEAFDGAGMYFETGEKKFSKPLGEIDIEAISQNPGAAVEYLEVHLDGLRRFERAERLEVVEKRDMSLLGTPALFIKDQYFDPQDRSTWVDEIILVKHREVLYRLELACRAEEIGRFDPVFTHFVSTFKFECNAKR